MLRQRSPRQKIDSHLDFIRGLPCVGCGNDIETQAAHLRTGDLYYGKRNTGGAEKPSDMWVLPLCGHCHTAQHKGNEMAFWKGLGINPHVLAMSLFVCTGEHETALQVIELQTRRA